MFEKSELETKIKKISSEKKDKFNRLEIKMPLTLDSVEEMINNFQDENLTLDGDCFTKIIDKSLEIFQKAPLMVEVKIPKDGKMVVVGDIHGQVKK